MMKLPSFPEITNKAQNAFNRFPVTLVWVVLGSFFCIYLLEDNSNDLWDQHSDTVLTLVLGVSWFIGTQFFIEQLKTPKKGLWLKAIVLVLLIIFHFHFPNWDVVDQDPTYFFRFFLYLIAGHLFVLFAPFILKWANEAYWNYLKSIGYAIIRSAFFSGVLYLGLVLALVAIDALFDMHIRGERYGQLFIFCLGIVNTWIYLSDFPKAVLQNSTITFNKALEVFVKYILIPLVILYIIILYAYGLKIILQWELPQGWVSYLVTALALLGFVVQVIINPVQKSLKSWTIASFYPWFYVLMLPLLVLLFVAIFRRISDYGITENRYFVLIIAFWILGMSLYMLTVQKQKLKILPISLFILALMASLGPWSAFNISRKSQVLQFKKVFDSVKSNNSLANSKQFEQLKSILSYLDERDALTELDPITGIQMQIAFKDSLQEGLKNYGWLNTAKVLDSLGIALNPQDMENNPGYGDYYNYYQQWDKRQNFDITDYNLLTTLNVNSNNKDSIDLGEHFLKFHPEFPLFTLHNAKDGKSCLELPLKEKLEDLKLYGNNLYTINPEKMVMEFKNDSITAKIIFTDLGFYAKGNSIEIGHSVFHLLLKKP